MEKQTIIKKIIARKVFDSRGEETIEIEVETFSAKAVFAAPAGKSKGAKEVEYYPKGGVNEAVRIFNKEIAPKLINLDSCNQIEIDNILKEIDGTERFEVIGGNTAIATSLAIAEVAAKSLNIPLFMHLGGVFSNILPLPLGNVLGGGKHAGEGAPDIQEYLVVPLNPRNIYEAIQANITVHKKLGEILSKNVKGFTKGKGDEGAYAPNIDSLKALEYVSEAVNETMDNLGIKIGIGLDVAASSLWNEKEKVYFYSRENIKLNTEEQIERMLYLIDKYKIVYLEDPLHEDDFEGFSELTKKSKNTLICGDDIFTTRKELLEKGYSMKAGNAIIIKPNQVGTLTDTYKTIDFAKKHGYTPVASHRSGETEYGYLAHIAVGFNCSMIKAGVMGGERIAKANELIRISEYLGNFAKMASLGVDIK